MSIKQLIEDLQIRKILVVDDSKENIDAAKKYFENEIVKYGVSFTYVLSGEVAKDEIKKEFDAGKKVDFVMTDLQMETKNAGCDVLIEAYRYDAEGVVVTGRNYQNPNDHDHGPTTYIKSIHPCFENLSVAGRKSKPEVWKQCFEKSLILVSESPIHDAIERYGKFVSKKNVTGKDDVIHMIKFSIDSYIREEG